MLRIPPPPHPTRKFVALLVIASAWALAAPTAAEPPPKQVDVVNSLDEPVPVVDVGTPERRPFQIETFLNVAGFLHDTLFSVPLGQRAVIETVSALVTFPVPVGVGGFLSVETTVDGNKADHFLVLTTQGTVLASEARTANHAVRLYADAETQIFLNGAIQVGSALHVSLSGYLVDVP